MIDFIIEENNVPAITPKISVIGIGGGGNNTINALIDAHLTAINFIAVNTDAQSLQLSRASHRVNIGVHATKGLGTGDNPELGKKAAEENLAQVLELVEDADVIFLVAGMGGGTGSGALPVIAQALSEKEVLTIALVTRPFDFEGKRRARVANNAIEQLTNTVDTLIVVPNQKLLESVDHPISMLEGFGMVNTLLAQSICSIADIITKPGHINVDFADVRTIMKKRGLSIIGTGKASGPQRAHDAAMQAISCPLIEQVNLNGVQGVLLHITGGTQLRLDEIGQAASVIYKQAHDDAHIIIGSTIDESLHDDVVVTIIATGLAKEIIPNKIITPSPFIPAKSSPTPEPINQCTTSTVEFIASPRSDAITTPPPSIAALTNQHDSNTMVNHDTATEPATPIDLMDLDVPTFLRDELRKRSE